MLSYVVLERSYFKCLGFPLQIPLMLRCVRCGNRLWSASAFAVDRKDRSRFQTSGLCYERSLPYHFTYDHTFVNLCLRADVTMRHICQFCDHEGSWYYCTRTRVQQAPFLNIRRWHHTRPLLKVSKPHSVV